MGFFCDPDKYILKIIWERKGENMAMIFVKKNQKEGFGFALSEIKYPCKTVS